MGLHDIKMVGGIYVMNGNRNAQKYRNEILQLQLKISMHDDNNTFLFQQESASCHIAKICKKLYKKIIFLMFEWQELKIY